MNHCILVADIVQAPQLRYTSDNQTSIAEFVAQFPGLRENDPPSQVKVVGWGNLAQEIHENYREGERVVLEGRLSMNTVERPEGFKEKQAEMTVQRVYRLNDLSAFAMAPATSTVDVGPGPSAPPQTASKPAPPAEEPDYDDIPF